MTGKAATEQRGKPPPVEKAETGLLKELGKHTRSTRRGGGGTGLGVTGLGVTGKLEAGDGRPGSAAHPSPAQHAVTQWQSVRHTTGSAGM